MNLKIFKNKLLQKTYRAARRKPAGGALRHSFIHIDGLLDRKIRALHKNLKKTGGTKSD